MEPLETLEPVELEKSVEPIELIDIQDYFAFLDICSTFELSLNASIRALWGAKAF